MTWFTVVRTRLVERLRRVVADPAPMIWSTLLATLFFGVFAFLVLVAHAGAARELGRSTKKYSIAFGCALVVHIAVLVYVFTAPHSTGLNDPSGYSDWK